MPPIESTPLPQEALLRSYCRAGVYTDCYTTWVAGDVSQAAYVQAFYTTPVFRLERLILRVALSRGSTDADVEALALGHIERFAAWDVEQRNNNQLLLCDMAQRTRSWLMSEPELVQREPGTRLYFGSAVVPAMNRQTGRLELGGIYRALLGFHKLYSRVLLRAAVWRLRGQRT